MGRKSSVYRRWRYVKRRNSVKVHIALRLLAAVLVLAVSAVYLSAYLLPKLRQAVDAEIREAWTTALSESAEEVFDRGTSHRDLILFESSDAGISTISLNGSSLEGHTDELLRKADKKLGLPGAGKLSVSLTGPNSLFFRKGGILDFDVEISRDTRTTVDYRPEYIPVNEGQTRMAVKLHAEAVINYRGSFLEGSTKVSAELTAAEYIIFGRLPGK